MAASRIRDKGQVTLPAEIREAAHLEAGDPVEFEVVAEGILLRPQKVIDASQSWFWTDEWQQREREASEAIRDGRTEIFKSGEEFLGALKRREHSS